MSAARIEVEFACPSCGGDQFDPHATDGLGDEVSFPCDDCGERIVYTLTFEVSLAPSDVVTLSGSETGGEQ